MSAHTVGMAKDTIANLKEFLHEYPLWKQTELLSYSLNWFIDYFRKYQALPPKNYKHIRCDENISTIIECASDLPGMTAEVIQSHLVRFPKVTPEAYKGIIEELRQRQNSEEGLKNPEAAAYGLCKRIQNGQSRAATPQDAPQAQPASVPDDNPFAVY